MKVLSLKLPRVKIATTTLTLAVSVMFLLVLGVAAQKAKPSRPGRQGKAEASETPVTQPIPFSHKTHSDQNIECAVCHSNPDPGESMAFPDSTLCMACHQAVAAEKPAIKKLARFAQSKKTIPWVRIYSVPAFVFWSHRTHLQATQQCADCHGNVSEMDVLRSTNVTTMDGCVQCHEKKDASTGCVTCHEGRGARLDQPFKLQTVTKRKHRNPDAQQFRFVVMWSFGIFSTSNNVLKGRKADNFGYSYTVRKAQGVNCLSDNVVIVKTESAQAEVVPINIAMSFVVAMAREMDSPSDFFCIGCREMRTCEALNRTGPLISIFPRFVSIRFNRVP